MWASVEECFFGASSLAAAVPDRFLPDMWVT
jgi:hypothetical protein